MAVIRTPLSDSEDVISHDATTTELLKKGMATDSTTEVQVEAHEQDLRRYIPFKFLPKQNHPVVMGTHSIDIH